MMAYVGLNWNVYIKYFLQLLVMCCSCCHAKKYLFVFVGKTRVCIGIDGLPGEYPAAVLHSCGPESSFLAQVQRSNRMRSSTSDGVFLENNKLTFV